MTSIKFANGKVSNLDFNPNHGKGGMFVSGSGGGAGGASGGKKNSITSPSFATENTSPLMNGAMETIRGKRTSDGELSVSKRGESEYTMYVSGQDNKGLSGGIAMRQNTKTGMLEVDIFTPSVLGDSKTTIEYAVKNKTDLKKSMYSAANFAANQYIKARDTTLASNKKGLASIPSFKATPGGISFGNPG